LFCGYNRYPLIEIAEFSIAPPNAHSTIFKKVNFVIQLLGGYGTVCLLFYFIVEFKTNKTDYENKII